MEYHPIILASPRALKARMEVCQLELEHHLFAFFQCLFPLLILWLRFYYITVHVFFSSDLVNKTVKSFIGFALDSFSDL
jgi:hypothetical protein